MLYWTTLHLEVFLIFCPPYLRTSGAEPLNMIYFSNYGLSATYNLINTSMTETKAVTEVLMHYKLTCHLSRNSQLCGVAIIQVNFDFH